jgi:Rrf2 family protein
MQITRQADYAVRAVLYLAERGRTSPIATAEIGRQQHIPLTFLAKIMSQLSAAGIVHTLRGVHGGIRLGRPVEEISLLDILETIDGPILLNECVSDPSLCPLGENCAVHNVWCQAQADLVDRLSRTTMAKLVQPGARSIAPLETERQGADPIATGRGPAVHSVPGQ